MNGVLVTLLKLPPFIVTLGTWSIFGALNLWYSRSETIRQQDVEAAAPFLQWLGTAFRFWGARLTYGSLLMLALAAFIWYVLQRTAFGRHVYATGNDPDAARLAGINIAGVLIARLYHRRADLRDRRLGADRAHRRDQRDLRRRRPISTRSPPS